MRVGIGIVSTSTIVTMSLRRNKNSTSHTSVDIKSFQDLSFVPVFASMIVLFLRLMTTPHPLPYPQADLDYMITCLVVEKVCSQKILGICQSMLLSF